MFNSNSSNNRARFGSADTTDENKGKFRLQITAGLILVLAIIKLIFGMTQGFQSDLFTSLFILLVTTCGNGFIAGYLVISLCFDFIVTCVFFLIQLQNFVLSIVNPLPKNALLVLWGLNILGCILYSFAIYYCYRFFTETTGNQRGYNILGDQNQTSSYGTMGDRESNPNSNNNFKPFSGKGATLDG